MAGDGEEVLARPESSGLDRRALIKRAAAVGAAAWTAPLIVQSLLSPAGAVTAGCVRAHLVLDPDDNIFNCEPMPTNLAAWTNTCDGDVAVGSCGALGSIPVATGTLASLGITRSVCNILGSTLTLSATNCSWVGGALFNEFSDDCRDHTGINNGTAGSRTISFDRGTSVTDYFLVISCS
jgi:hypothetical protein